jgi:hypothetical protein
VRGEKEECSEGWVEPGRAFRVRRRLGGRPSRERSQSRQVEREESIPGVTWVGERAKSGDRTEGFENL